MARAYKIILVGLLLFLLYWRWQVSAARFFDADEFSYLHWTAQVAQGQRMYVDFFSYFTPGFMWAFAPLFFLFGAGVQVFAAARVLSFVIFLGILGSVGYLFGITRGWKWALLPVIILAFLPMPYDKFLEIRPDNLATLLGILGMIGIINKRWFVSGLLYSFSLMTLAKTLPFAAVGSGVALLAAEPTFFAGLCAPWLLFFGGAALGGHIHEVWYSVTKLPFEVYKSAANAAMEADLFFFPNTSFYGTGPGVVTPGLLANNALWVLGAVFGAYRTVTPFSKKFLTELLVGLTFFVSVFGYVKFFPLKHSQYLIPIAVFIAYYSADALSQFFDWLEQKGGKESLLIILGGLAWMLITITQLVNAPKLVWTKDAQMKEVQTLLATVPASAVVVDFEGRMLWWPSGYPVCCLPIDSTLSFVSERPIPLADYLTLHPSSYIFFGDTGRWDTLTPQNQAYIRSTYVPVVGWGERLWKHK